jgi:hypothetical protein
MLAPISTDLRQPIMGAVARGVSRIFALWRWWLVGRLVGSLHVLAV